MGIIVSDDFETKNGIVIGNYYVNVDNIQINKSNVPDFKYEINATEQIYVNKSKRDDDNTCIISTKRVGYTSNVLSNIHEELYTKVKTGYTSYTDEL